MKGNLLTALLLIQCPFQAVSACEVKLPEARDLPPELQSAEDFVWVGSPALAALVPSGGVWKGMGPGGRFRDKWWWWRAGYRALDEPVPELEITATRLDGEAPPVHNPHATNAMEAFDPPDPSGWQRILTMLEFPAPGCWAVSATYHGERLQFVFLVGG